jgi:hypothetical protein
MSTTPDADPELPDDAAAPTLGRTAGVVALAIAGSTLLLAAPSYFIAGGKFAAAVLLGGAIGIANFLVLARIGKALTGTRAGAAFWGGVYFFKIAALFGGLYLLFATGAVNLYGLLVGLSAIVPGIVVGGLLATPRSQG